MNIWQQAIKKEMNVWVVGVAGVKELGGVEEGQGVTRIQTHSMAVWNSQKILSIFKTTKNLKTWNPKQSQNRNNQKYNKYEILEENETAKTVTKFPKM